VISDETSSVPSPPFDKLALRDAFRFSNMDRSQRALWCRDYPGAEPNTCRYCGRHWRQWAGSKLDGHAACILTEDSSGKWLTSSARRLG